MKKMMMKEQEMGKMMKGMPKMKNAEQYMNGKKKMPMKKTPAGVTARLMASQKKRAY